MPRPCIPHCSPPVPCVDAAQEWFVDDAASPFVVCMLLMLADLLPLDAILLDVSDDEGEAS
jgi:hypothetical protein